MGLSVNEYEALEAVRDGFECYCRRVTGGVPAEGSNDWNRLARAYLAWSAARELEYGDGLHADQR